MLHIFRVESQISDFTPPVPPHFINTVTVFQALGLGRCTYPHFISTLWIIRYRSKLLLQKDHIKKDQVQLFQSCAEPLRQPAWLQNNALVLDKTSFQLVFATAPTTDETTSRNMCDGNMDNRCTCHISF